MGTVQSDNNGGSERYVRSYSVATPDTDKLVSRVHAVCVPALC